MRSPSRGIERSLGSTQIDETRRKLDKVLSDKNALFKSARASFKQFDKDNSGQLELQETRKLIARLCQNLDVPPVDDATLKRVVARYDCDGSGALQLEEFARMYWDLLLRIRDKFYPSKSLRVKRSYFVGRMNLRESGMKIEELYDFEKHLGAGSFGEVHLVKEQSSGLHRVCKTINKSRAALPAEQIEAEINFMKTLDHPNIIKIYEVYEDANSIYILMETCEGGELLDRIIATQKSGRRMSEKYVAYLMQQIMEAVCYIHSHKIAHKDLKPENIMFQDKTTQSPLKVIDFGVAEMFNHSDRSRNAAGTALYMAPEVFQRCFGLKCDIWSAGVIMFLLLAGRLPFNASSMSQLQLKVQRADPPIASACGHASADAQSLLKAMLHKDPKKRPSGVEVLKHKWFKFAPDVSLSLSDEVTDNLANFMNQSELKKAMVNLVAHQLNVTGAQIRNINRMFRSLDADGNGTLTQAELTKGLEECGWSPWDITKIVQALDLDGSGMINYTEFVAACYTWQESELNLMWAAFQKMDTDGDGVIGTDEFAKILLGDTRGRRATRKELESMVAEIDINGDGLISWDEFEDYMRHERDVCGKGEDV